MASQRDKIERLARYVSRPPVATERLSLTRGGNVRYALKTPYRDGTTHVIFEPEDFVARLAALVPKPRAHLTRYHGVFAPASPDRAKIVPRTHAVAATERLSLTRGGNVRYALKTPYRDGTTHRRFRSTWRGIGQRPATGDVMGTTPQAGVRH
jgi:hypothetical protein